MLSIKETILTDQTKKNERPSFLGQILCAKTLTISVYNLPKFFNYARHVNVDLIFVSSGRGLLNIQLKKEEKKRIDIRKTVVFHTVFNDRIDLRNIRYKIFSLNMIDFYWTGYLSETDLLTTQITLLKRD